MRSLDSARSSWQELKRYQSLQELKEAVRLDGRSSIATEGCRSACWKAFLLFETLDVSSWLRTLSSSRSAYNSVRAHCLRHLENSDELEAGYNPLSENVDASPSTQVRQDEELRAEILQDVTRCMPENLYFRQPDTQRMLLDILFIFCKLNPDVSYRQGMHELLAPILWVVERDAIDLGRSSKALGEDATIVNIFDPYHIEHDTFALFGEIMQSAKNFYEQSTTSGKENPIVVRSQRIFKDLLPMVDEELAKHLESIDIVPQVFLMRWIRLLFGREFPFDDMLTIWDVIFAEDSSLNVVNEICVAMILRIRWRLVEADYNEALTLLLRYPELEKDFSAQTLALDALYLREHMDYHGGSYLIAKYTDRPIYQTRRPATPPALQRKITQFSGALAGAMTSRSSADSPSRASGSARNVDSLFQSTAKEIYARGEKLGIGKAVRSAVDEVHKRAQEIRDAPTPSPPRVHQQRRSQSSLGPYALQDRVKTLEGRSKQLAKLLEGALAELMDYHKRTAALEESSGDPTSHPTAEDLGVAIAKVQFVQVYLDDPKLLLPTDSHPMGDVLQAGDSSDQRPEAKGLHAENDVRGTRDVSPISQKGSSGGIESQSAIEPRFADLADPSSFDLAETSETRVPEIVIEDGAKQSATNISTTQSQTEVRSSAPRPRLDQSPYSWMLGEQDMSATPFNRTTSLASERGQSKGFLFEGEPESSNKKAGKPTQGDTFDLGSLRHGRR